MPYSALDSAVGDPARLEALYRLRLLDTPAQEAFDRLTRLVRATLHVPVALVTLVDVDRQFLLSADGLPEPWATRRQTPLTHSFCRHVLGTGTPLVVPDALADPVLCTNGAIQDLGVAAYLGVPLRTSTGHVMGAICAIDTAPRLWTDADQRLLADLGALAADQLALRELAVELDERVAQETTRRLAAQDELARKRRLEALGQLAGGVAHDFANVLQSVQSGVHLIRNALTRDPARALRVLDAMTESVRRGGAVTRRLLSFARRGEAQLGPGGDPIDAATVLEELREVLAHTLNRPGLEIVAAAPPGLPLHVDRGELEAVLINLATNARDAMPQSGRLSILAAAETVTGEGHPASLAPGRYIRLLTEDNGTGMPPDVLARAAEPFFSTKPEGVGTGLGLSMAREFAEAAGGAMAIDSAPGQGTRVTLWLRLPDPDP